jgi:DNA-binding winged helix-turn-helix (wHTH) protein
VDAHRLERAGETIKLEPKATRVLVYLVRHAGAAVRREELFRSVWPAGAIVGDDALTTAVNTLRRAFGDDLHDPRNIETIPKMGYRLVAAMDHPAVMDPGRVDAPAGRRTGLAHPWVFLGAVL